MLETEEPRLRDASEIQRAHDILKNIVLEEIPVKVDQAPLYASLDVLCWVLRHDHNHTFADNLDGVEEAALAAGFMVAPRPDASGE
jgi:hypothetical protein